MANRRPVIEAIETTAANNPLPGNQRQTVNAPAGITSGEVLLVIANFPLTSGISMVTSGWNFFEQYVNPVLGVWWKVSDGTEGNVVIQLAGSSTASYGRIFHYLRLSDAKALEGAVGSGGSFGQNFTINATVSSYDGGLAFALAALRDWNNALAMTSVDWTELYNDSRNGTDVADITSFIATQDADNGATTPVTMTQNASTFRSRMQFVVTSIDAPDPLSITEQPEDAYVGVGSAATFSVTANGDAPFTYQWYSTRTGLISNGNTRNLSVVIIDATQEGEGFYCEVNDQGPDTQTSNTAFIQKVGNPGYDGNALRNAILTLNPRTYYNLNDRDLANQFVDATGNGFTTTSFNIQDDAQPPLIDDGGSSVLLDNVEPGPGQFIAVNNAPELAPADWTFGVVVQVLSKAASTPYLYVPQRTPPEGVARFGMWCRPFGTTNLGDTWATHLLKDASEEEHRGIDVNPNQPDPAVRCPALLYVMRMRNNNVRWYVLGADTADNSYIQTDEYTFSGDLDYNPAAGADIQFLGRSGLKGGLTGYAQHMFLLGYAIDEADLPNLDYEFRRSCARFTGTPPPADAFRKSMLVYNYEDDNFTWADASVDNTELDDVLCMAYELEQGWAVRWSDLEEAETTWNILEIDRTEWSDFYFQGKEKSLYWLTDDAVYKSDQTIVVDGNKEYYVERVQLDFDDLVTSWTSNVQKYMRQWYFHMVSPDYDGSKNTFDVQVGWSDNLMDAPNYYDADTIEVAPTEANGKVKWDFRSTGRYLAIKMDFSKTYGAVVTGADVDVEESYGR